jgi:outer membrane receptor protein involved in Fe transport
MARLLPGHGFRLELTGRFVGSRYADLWGREEIDPYILLNFHVGKRLADNFEIGVSVFNILNQDYEIRKGYREPDLVSTGVLRMYW